MRALTYDAIVLGAGAAGMMCAMTAGGRGKRILLLDHAAEAGKKILISGGGRCNFTNLIASAERFISDNPHFCKAALAAYGPRDFLALVEKHRIAWHEKALGQLFCDGSAQQIVRMLLDECAAGGVEIRLGQAIREVSRDTAFRVRTDEGVFSAPALVLATGGLSIPKMGATGFSYEVARQFGLPLTDIAPALVPLTFEGEALGLMRPLSGVSLDVVARVGKRAFAEPMLFTHRGLSGPSILQISSYWRAGAALMLDLLPGQKAALWLRAQKLLRPNAMVRTVLGELLPHRLAQAWPDVPEGAIGQVRDTALAAVGVGLSGWRLVPSGTEGYAKAEVTRGGVSTEALAQGTMEAKAVPRLFVVGEAVDVTGWLGGYNFQWAWASGWCAGVAV
jgi:predicted Rossmann fold flavoprotein